MHWGALQGNIAGCRALIKAGARLDIADDKVSNSTCDDSK